MKSRLFPALVLAAVLSGPAMARPTSVKVRPTSPWIRTWNGFLGLFHGFRLFTGAHDFPPPSSADVISLS